MSRPDVRPRAFSAAGLHAALSELGTSPEPGYLDDIVTQTRRTRQRPAWTFPERWLPMTTTFPTTSSIPLARPRSSPRLRPLIVVLALALLALIGAAFLSAGGSPSPTTVRNGLIAYDAFGDIWTMRADGSERRQLTSGPALDISPKWSPDGTRIAFASWPNEDPIGPGGEGFEAAARRWMPQSPSIVVMEADGSKPTALGTMVGSDSFIWSPDSTGFVYDTGTELRMGSTGGPKTTELILPGRSPGAAPAWSPDGRTIAYKGGDDVADSTLGLWTVDVEDGGSRLVSEPIGSDEDIGGVVWSPDGSSIAFFVGPASGGAFDVHIAAADGSGETLVTTAGPDEYWPAWAPDGSRLAFDRVVVPSNNLVQVVVADPVTSTEVMLDSEPLFGVPLVWAPDSSEIVAQLPADADAASAWGWASHLVFLDPSGAAAPRLVEADGAFGTQSWQRVAP
jgi:dipeptidyl aminopeptidase/acylaminoacyl peptidase